uniref:Uncharacterized protein n=1 Tax=Romanomermis culicivorax TaxID=13658 RepID=A0A915JIY0_ROMCU
MPQLIVEPLTR